jgi:class 3 adenylate cyclase
MGDGFMLTFGSPQDGARCAVAVQRTLATDNPLPADPLRVRIGLHTGEVIHEGTDVFGHHVNLSARIASVAKGMQITLSDAARKLLGGREFTCLDRGETFLRGFAEPVRIHELLWE